MVSTLEENINYYLTCDKLEKKWNKDKTTNTGYFYSITYKIILCFFKSNYHLDQELEHKIALIFSWNPTICKIEKEKYAEAKEELQTLRATQMRLAGKSINDFDVHSDLKPLWNAIKKATSLNKSKAGVSVTKFLHFSFPDIFPMVDNKRIKELYDKESVNLRTYTNFLKEWKAIYKKNESAFKDLSKKMDMPVARILDIMIFTPY